MEANLVKPRPKIPFLFLGNQMALDFINTEIIYRGKRVSLIENYDELRAWFVDAGIVSEQTIAAAEPTWDVDERGAFARHALDLRASIRTCAGQIAAGEAIGPEIVDDLNELLKRHAGYSQIVRHDGGYARGLQFALTSADDLLWPIAEAAAHLITGVDHAHVRKCETCILYFYDNSKNHARRWCSMKICGNRHKQAMHYRRTHPGGE